MALPRDIRESWKLLHELTDHTKPEARALGKVLGCKVVWRLRKDAVPLIVLEVPPERYRDVLLSAPEKVGGVLVWVCIEDAEWDRSTEPN